MIIRKLENRQMLKKYILYQNYIKENYLRNKGYSLSLNSGSTGRDVFHIFRLKSMGRTEFLSCQLLDEESKIKPTYIAVMKRFFSLVFLLMIPKTYHKGIKVFLFL